MAESIGGLIFAGALLIIIIILFGKRIVAPFKHIYDETKKIDKNEEQNEKIEKQLEKVINNEKFVLIAQTKILDHLITGNGVNEMKRTKNEIMDYLEKNI